MSTNGFSELRIFGNGFRVMYANGYTVDVKIGPGTKTTPETKGYIEAADVFRKVKSRFGGISSPDVELEIFDTLKEDVTSTLFPDLVLQNGYVALEDLSEVLFRVSLLPRKESKRTAPTQSVARTIISAIEKIPFLRRATKVDSDVT